MARLARLAAPLAAFTALAAPLACDGSAGLVAPEPAVVLWSAEVGGRAAGPVVAGGRVLVLDPPFLTARDPLTGAVAWSLEVAGGDPTAFPALTARGGAAYALDADLAAVAIADGTVLWSVPAAGGGFLGADSERLYRFRQAALTALDPATGAVLWEAALSEPFGAAALGAGVVCLAGARVTCRDGPSGATLWVATPPEPSMIVDLDVGAGSVIAATAAGELLAYDTRTGTLVWRRSLGAPLRGSTAAGLAVVACASDGEAGACLALEESNGAPRWELDTRGAVSTPVAAGERIIVVDERGILLVEVSSGRVARRIVPPAAGFDQALLVPAGDFLCARLFGRLYAIGGI